MAKCTSLRQSIFLEMFGNPVTNPRHWPVKKFAEIGVLDRGVSRHRPRNAPELLGGPYPLIQTGDAANCDGYIRDFKSTYSDLGLRQSRLWATGTLCITIAANIAKTGILTFPACFPDSVVGFTPNHIAETEYVQTWLSFLQAMLEANAPESAQKNINLAILRELDVPVPPVAMQEGFVAGIKKVEQLKSDMVISLMSCDAAFASLQHRAFRGEL
jgi:type I restriction enzyme S subunit